MVDDADTLSHLSEAIEKKNSIRFTYRNYKNQTGVRTVLPMSLYEGATEFHPDRQWMLEGLDLDKNEIRRFAVKDILTRVESL